jgi:molecular chaperone GrpE
MEKDQNINSENQNEEIKESEAEGQNQVEQEISADKTEEAKDVPPEEKIKEIEDKLTRTFAEKDNQTTRFEKEKDDAF